MYFLHLNSRIGTVTLFEKPLVLIEKWHGSGNLWLFVPVSHQSAYVKSKPCRGLDSHRADSPTNTASLAFYNLPLFCLHAQYNPYLLNSVR